MKSNNILTVLSEITSKSEKQGFETPIEYLQKFLTNLSNLFNTNELIFMNAQYLYLDDNKFTPIKFNRIPFTPAIVNTKIASKEYLIQKLYGVLAFFKSMHVKGYLGRLDFGLPESLLKKKFVLETILDDKICLIKPLEYDSEENRLRINCPNLFFEKNFDRCFNNLDEKIIGSMNHLNDVYDIIDGGKFDTLMFEIIKKDFSTEFFLKISKIFKQENVVKYIDTFKVFYRKNYINQIPFDSENDMEMLIESALFHSYFKGIKYSYQIPFMSNRKDKNYCDLGALFLTTKCKLSKEKIDAIKIAFEIAIKDLREFTLSEHIIRTQIKESKSSENNGLDKAQINLLKILRENKFNISQTTELLNSNGDRPIRRKTIIRYTKEMFIYYLAKNNWDLEKAVHLISNGQNNRNHIVQKYADYFLGNKGIIPTLINGAEQDKLTLKKSVRIKYHKYLSSFEKHLKEKVTNKNIFEKQLNNYLQ
ncbi:MAG: hypothetical protein IPH62_06820 [Ignavibacteriae bacterium]|nr:hypothetical protein [Ignavibacteriota bacterium]